MTYDVEKIRNDFPILKREINSHPLVYLDNAATTLKPKQVVDCIANHYLMETSNVHRGIHFLSNQATDRYEQSRKTLAQFVHARSDREIVFTSGTTGSINLVAHSYGESQLRRGDEVLISELEHHSNIVPWQMLCEKVGATLKIIQIDEKGQIDLDDYKKKISEKTKILSVNYISNSIGTINPIEEMIAVAKKFGTKVCIDAAQAPCHFKIDVQKLDCDFLALSSHKMCGPTGVGLLWAREDLLEEMPPLFGGGDMISEVTFAKSTWNEVPFKFEAGTPHIAGVIGFAEAAKYIQSIGIEQIQQHEKELYGYAKERLEAIEGIQFFGQADNKAAIFSFGFSGIHSTDLGTIMDQYGVAVRTGHHCTQPLMKIFGVSGTARASLSFYNNREDVDRLVFAIEKAKEFLT